MSLVVALVIISVACSLLSIACWVNALRLAVGIRRDRTP